MSALPHQAGPTITVEEISEMNHRDLLRIFGMAEALLAARELLAATAEMVGPDTPADELLRHLTQYRAHLSALAAGGLPLTETQRRLAGHDVDMQWTPAVVTNLGAGPGSGRPAGRPITRQDA
jgi:hypothetical protein